jgi:hypothetical protein
VGTFIRTINVDPLLADYEFDVLMIIYNYWFRSVVDLHPFVANFCVLGNHRSRNDTIIRNDWNTVTATLSYAIARALDDRT